MPPVDERTAHHCRLLSHDERLLQCLWQGERLGWLALLVLLPMLVLGLARSGPLGWAEAGADGKLRVRYERLPLQAVPSRLVMHSRAGAEGRVWLTLAGPLAQHLLIEQIRPRPAAAQRQADRLLLRFETAPYDWLRIELIARPRRAGLAASQVRAGDETLPVTQWVLP